MLAREKAATDTDPTVAEAAKAALAADVHRQMLSRMGRVMIAPSTPLATAPQRLVRCPNCGTLSLAGTGACPKCQWSLEEPERVWPDPEPMAERELLITLVQEQRELLEAEDRLTRYLKPIRSAARLWMVLTIIGLVIGVLWGLITLLGGLALF